MSRVIVCHCNQSRRVAICHSLRCCRCSIDFPSRSIRQSNQCNALKMSCHTRTLSSHPLTCTELIPIGNMSTGFICTVIVFGRGEALCVQNCNSINVCSISYVALLHFSSSDSLHILGNHRSYLMFAIGYLGPVAIIYPWILVQLTQWPISSTLYIPWDCSPHWIGRALGVTPPDQMHVE